MTEYEEKIKGMTFDEVLYKSVAPLINPFESKDLTKEEIEITSRVLSDKYSRGTKLLNAIFMAGFDKVEKSGVLKNELAIFNELMSVIPSAKTKSPQKEEEVMISKTVSEYKKKIIPAKSLLESTLINEGNYIVQSLTGEKNRYFVMSRVKSIPRTIQKITWEIFEDYRTLEEEVKREHGKRNEKAFAQKLADHTSKKKYTIVGDIFGIKQICPDCIKNKGHAEDPHKICETAEGRFQKTLSYAGNLKIVEFKDESKKEQRKVKTISKKKLVIKDYEDLPIRLMFNSLSRELLDYYILADSHIHYVNRRPANIKNAIKNCMYNGLLYEINRSIETRILDIFNFLNLPGSADSSAQSSRPSRLLSLLRR